MSASGSSMTASSKPAKPPPTGPPPTPPTSHTSQNTNHNRNTAATTNGTNGHAQGSQSIKKKTETAVDQASLYESLRNRISALEETEHLEEEEERRFAEEAHSSVKGLNETSIHSKYLDLFTELKRLERDHAKERQKLMKDKDAAKSQLTKTNQTKTKMESLARELQKENKRLREDTKRLSQSMEEAQDEISQMKTEVLKRAEKTKAQDAKFLESPDIVVKVVCRYRAELFFKISRKTKLSRLFQAWTDRMDASGILKQDGSSSNGKAENTASTSSDLKMEFMFTHNGRVLDSEQTLQEAGIEDSEEVIAIELMDLTDETGAEDWDDYLEPVRPSLKKNWTDDPVEAKRSIDNLFNAVIKDRLKEILRQYELRERHFECIIRSKELEVLLCRARAAEQKQLADRERTSRTGSEDVTKAPLPP